MKRCLLCVLPPPPWIRSSRCFKTLSPSPHARPARPIGPAKPPHVPRSTSHDLPARSDSIAPGSTSASLTPNATSLRAPSLPRSPACPSAAGARTTGERTRTSGVGAARGPSGGQFAGRAAAWRDVTAAQKVPTGRSVPGNPCVCWLSAVTCHSLENTRSTSVALLTDFAPCARSLLPPLEADCST